MGEASEIERRRGADKEGGGGDGNRSKENGVIAHMQDNISGPRLFTHVRDAKIVFFTE